MQRVRYLFLAILGLAGGFLGEELGVRIIDLVPGELIVADFRFVQLLPVFSSFIPFLAISGVLVFGMDGYRSYWKGTVLSLAYYLPFQYKTIVAAIGEVDPPFGSLQERILATLAGTMVLSLVYFGFINLRERRGSKKAT